jgi:hypothetical protein
MKEKLHAAIKQIYAINYSQTACKQLRLQLQKILEILEEGSKQIGEEEKEFLSQTRTALLKAKDTRFNAPPSSWPDGQRRLEFYQLKNIIIAELNKLENPFQPA